MVVCLTLLHGFRGEIAACSSASYTTLPLATAQQMMYFDSEQDLLTYISDSQVRCVRASRLSPMRNSCWLLRRICAARMDCGPWRDFIQCRHRPGGACAFR